MQTDFFLIGDSNSAIIGRAARLQGYRFKGGSIAPGRLFDGNFFKVQGDRFVMTAPEASQAQDQFADLLTWQGPILSTVGFNTQLIGQTVHRDMRTNGMDALKLSQAVLEALVENWKAPALAFYKMLQDRGRQVWFTHSPQRFPEVYFDLAIRLETILQQRLIDMGVPFIDVRATTTGPDGRLLEHLHSDLPNDKTHGGTAWGRAVFEAFAAQAQLAKVA